MAGVACNGEMHQALASASTATLRPFPGSTTLIVVSARTVHHLNANRPPPFTVKKLDEETFLNAAAAAGLAFKAFLAGPYIETTGKRPGPGEKNKAKRLRYDLFQKLSAIGWIVTLGEYEKLVGAANPVFGKRTTAANAEYLHARDHAHAIIMLPSSPGSFLELGAFSFNDTICQKMLIIIDKKHEADPPNYLNSGPLLSAKHRGSQVHYIDYDSIDDCWAVVSEFVIDQGERVAEDKMLGR